MVKVSHGRYPASQSGFTIPYQGAAPYQIHHVFDMCRPLPNITGIYARGAKPSGRLGLVYQRLPPVGSGSVRWHGNLYQAPPPGYEDRYYRLL